MLIDTHCHLTDRYADDLDGVMRRARDANVGILIAPSADPDDAAKVVKLAERFDNVYCTVGVHPEYGGNAQPADLINYLQYLSHPRVVGIGEIGLDYHYGDGARARQIELFTAQLEIARDARMPVAVHSRDADADTAEILGRPEFSSVGGVMHCYTSGWDLAKKMLDRGFYFSASGILTFKNAESVREVFRKLPCDRLVLETDAPFCAPAPYRGKTCEPFMITETARVLSAVRGTPMPELENILTENTKRLYARIQAFAIDGGIL
jgi:TatD DNase family protein